MKRLSTWFLSTIAVVVLLFAYKTSTSGPSQTAVGATADAPVDPSTAAATPIAGGGTTGTSYTGSVAQTRWGPVQVRITVVNGKIADVTVPQYPDGNGKDEQINSYALPVLTKNTLTNQNADIDMISGATVTSDGYVQSLQSALDQAGLA